MKSETNTTDLNFSETKINNISHIIFKYLYDQNMGSKVFINSLDEAIQAHIGYGYYRSIPGNNLINTETEVKNIIFALRNNAFTTYEAFLEVVNNGNWNQTQADDGYFLNLIPNPLALMQYPSFRVLFIPKLMFNIFTFELDVLKNMLIYQDNLLDVLDTKIKETIQAVQDLGGDATSFTVFIEQHSEILKANQILKELIKADPINPKLLEAATLNLLRKMQTFSLDCKNSDLEKHLEKFEKLYKKLSLIIDVVSDANHNTQLLNEADIQPFSKEIAMKVKDKVDLFLIQNQNIKEKLIQPECIVFDKGQQETEVRFDPSYQ